MSARSTRGPGGGRTGGRRPPVRRTGGQKNTGAGLCPLVAILAVVILVVITPLLLLATLARHLISPAGSVSVVAAGASSRPGVSNPERSTDVRA